MSFFQLPFLRRNSKMPPFEQMEVEAQDVISWRDEDERWETPHLNARSMSRRMSNWSGSSKVAATLSHKSLSITVVPLVPWLTFAC
jgi:hypothetical protein